MNCETNRFEELPEGSTAPAGWIPFNIGEEVEVKGWRFRICRVKPNRLVLEPLGRPNSLMAENSKAELVEQLNELKNQLR
jgi:hypothetical protein